jgi:hypothetical protein
MIILPRQARDKHRENSEETCVFSQTLRQTLDAHGHTRTQIVASDANWEPVASDFLADAGLREAVGALTQHYPHCDAVPGTPGAGKGVHCGAANHNALQAHRWDGTSSVFFRSSLSFSMNETSKIYQARLRT